MATNYKARYRPVSGRDEEAGQALLPHQYTNDAFHPVSSSSGPHAGREHKPEHSKLTTEEFQRQMLIHAKRTSRLNAAYLCIFVLYIIVILVLGGIAFNKFVMPLTSPTDSSAMLNPTNLNSAIATVYSTLGSADFIAQFAANVTGNMWQPAASAAAPKPEVPGPGSYGEAFTAALVNTTSHVGSIIRAVQPGAVGALMNGTAAALGSLNMTALGSSVQALLTQASGIAAEVQQSINPEDIQKLMGHVAEVDIAADIDRALTLGQTALSMVKNMGKTE